MSLLSQQEHPFKIAYQTQESMARPFDRHLSLTDPKPAGAARSRRATFPATTAGTKSHAMAPLTAPAKDTSQGGDQVVKKDEKKSKGELKHQILSRRSTFPFTARTELPTMTPLTTPVANASQGDIQSDKKNEPQYKGEPIQEILPQLYLGEYVPPTRFQIPDNALTMAPQSKSRREHRRPFQQGHILRPNDQRRPSFARRARRVSKSTDLTHPYHQVGY